MLYVLDAGSGDPPLVLLHGLGGGSSTWHGVIRSLHCSTGSLPRVLAADLLGFGRSPWPRSTYSVAGHLDAITETLAQRGLADRPISLAGHSLGAILAAELAAKFPERVVQLTLVNLPFFRSEGDAREHIATIGALARLTVTGHWAAHALCRVMCALRPSLRFAAPYFARHLPAAVARDSLLHNYTSYSRTLMNVIVRTRLDRAFDRLAAASMPITFLHGARDLTAPVNNVRRLIEGHPNWHLDLTPDATHYLPITHPDAVAIALRGGPEQWEAHHAEDTTEQVSPEQC